MSLHNDALFPDRFPFPGVDGLGEDLALIDTVERRPEFRPRTGADDVAATVADLATSAPAGGRVELGGPEALGIDAWARRLFAATGDERTVVDDPHARYFGTELHGGELTPGDGARIGTIDFETWFATYREEATR